MSRYTAAYSSFIVRLNEVEILLRFAKEKERSDAIKLRHEINALCRAAIVLLSSHLEAYVKELGELAIDSLHSRGIDRTKISSRIFYHISKDFFDDIRDASDPAKMAERLFSFLNDDLGYWSKAGSFPTQIPTERFNKGFSNPAFSKISSYIGRFGYETYKRDLNRALAANFLLTTNMVDHLVDTRNKIAHGDPAATKTPAETKQMMTIIRSYVASTDSIFSTWWRANFCSIR